MSPTRSKPVPSKQPTADKPPRRPSGSQAQNADNLESDNDSLQSVTGGLPAEDAADESGNRALQSVASGPNPNVGRDDVERPPSDEDGQGSVEST